MPPTRTRESDNQGQKTKKKFFKKPQHEEKTPGVQKIKSSIRQTKRLLAKDKLAADVRVETERRLAALEAELTQSEASRKERNMAVKYHKVKFFERQKLVRKITQTKKKLAEESQSTDALASTLYSLRVDLNYVLHYPKTKPYISLFPPEVRTETSTSISRSEPPPPNPERDAVRDWVRSKMSAGEMPEEPEMHLDSKGERGDDDWEQAKSTITKVKAKGKGKSDGKPKASTKLDQDEFFSVDDDDEE